MISDSLLLIRTYMLLDMRKGLARNGIFLVLTYLLIGLGAIAIAVGSAFAGYGAGWLLNQPEIPFRVNQGIFPGALLTFIFVGVLVFGLNQAVKALYLSGDLDRLVVAPIHTRSILIAKLASRMPWNIVFLLILVGPALIAYGLGIRAGVGYYFAGLVLLLLAPLFGMSIGTLIAMFLVRYLPAKRLNELLAAAYAVLGLLIGLIAQLPRFLGDPSDASAQTIESANAVLDSLSSSPIPTLMAGRGMIDLGAGNVGVGLSRMVAYVVLTLGLFLVTLLVADRLYLPGWLRMQGASSKRRGLSAEGGRFRNGSLGRAIGVKDWLLRFRDPRQLVTLVGGAVFGIIIGALALFQGFGDSGGLPTINAQSGSIAGDSPFRVFEAMFSPGVLVCAGVLFVSFLVFSTPAMTSTPLEGKSIDLLKVAPVSGRQVWWAKNNAVLWPFVVFTTVLLGVARIFVPFSLAWLPYGWLAMLFIGTGLIAANTSLGFRFADFNWTDPRKMTTTGGGFVGLIVDVIALFVGTVIAVGCYLLGILYPPAAIPAALVALVVLGGGTYLLMRLQARWADRAWVTINE